MNYKTHTYIYIIYQFNIYDVKIMIINRTFKKQRSVRSIKIPCFNILDDAYDFYFGFSTFFTILRKNIFIRLIEFI